MPNSPAKPLMTTDRVIASLLLAPSVVILSACHVPPPVAHAALQIRANGEFLLDKTSVLPADLTTALSARKVAGADLEVEVSASPEVNINVVQAAIESTKLAHVRVSFAGKNGVQ